jgi:hypothetical protein
MFEDLCGQRGKRGLLLDISLMRVYVSPSIFDKAIGVQREHDNLSVVVYYGKGAAVRLSKKAAAVLATETKGNFTREIGSTGVVGCSFLGVLDDDWFGGIDKDSKVHWVTTQPADKYWQPGKRIGPANA